MTPVDIGYICMALLVITLFTGIPIAFALPLVGVIGISWILGPSAAFSMLVRDVFEVFTSYPLTVITMFVLMGSYAFAVGIGARSFNTCHKLFGHLPGGLGIAAVAAATAFGAVCGSAAATAATIGKVTLPEMRKYGYNDSLSTGIVASAGGLGILIPPSSVFIVYGVITEQSIGKLFISGIIPGLILATLFVAAIFLECRRDPTIAPRGERVTFKAKLLSLVGVIDALVLFGVTMGGLFTGWFSPTQAGAIGAGGALLIGAVTRQLHWQNFLAATKEGLVIACMVLCLVAGATVFGHFLALSTLTTALVEWMLQLPLPSGGIIAIVFIIFFVGGCFVDTMPLVIILVPLFFPVITKLGYDPIWFAVIIVLLAAVGLVTPPVGVNAFVVNGISGVPLEKVFRGALPFIAGYVLAIAIVALVPWTATFLPSIIRY
jgi:tripartite ATP-independent transporter DctM subunit